VRRRRGGALQLAVRGRLDGLMVQQQQPGPLQRGASTATKCRWVVWAGLVAPQLCHHMIRASLPLLIAAIGKESLLSPAERVFLLSAFYPGYTVPQIPSGAAVRTFGGKQTILASLLVGLPLLAIMGAVSLPFAMAGSMQRRRTMWLLWLCMCGLGACQSPLVPCTSVMQREWMPKSLGVERVWALKTPMLAMKLARTLAPVVVPAIALRFGWRAVCWVYATGFVTGVGVWQATACDRVADWGVSMSESERMLLQTPAAPQTSLSSRVRGVGSKTRTKHWLTMCANPAVLACMLAHTSCSAVNITFAQWCPTIFIETLGELSLLARHCMPPLLFCPSLMSYGHPHFAGPQG
jgi:MFS family permease